MPEVCPQCSARFDSVEKLVQHVEEYHPSHGGSTTNPLHAQAAGEGRQQEVFRCPRCSRQFNDAVQLVRHSEGCGGGAGAGGAGGGGKKAGQTDSCLVC